ncbi:unnamed protein product [Symbiodinium sp. CCMP2592]|nr:unnamed protein product [Symbiodinium sp. CCMP2592]
MATDNNNPNAHDLPGQRQVMTSPSAANARIPDERVGTQLVNGVPGPLRGVSDIDGEVTTMPTSLGPASYSMRAPSNEQLTSTAAAQPTVQSGMAGGGFLVGPERQGVELERTQAPTVGADPLAGMAQGTVLTEIRGQVRTEGAEATGMLSGMLRTVQTVPMAIDAVVNRSASVQSAGVSGGRHDDSVEYASVRTSTPGVGSNAVPLDGGSAQAGLFDQQALDRLQRMQDQAPLLYPSGASSPPRPPSTTSSDLQAEVRRQLADMMRLRDEESRRLRAQVEALSYENQSLRLRMEASVQEGMQPSRSEGFGSFGFPSFGWFGRGLGSLMGPSRPIRGLESAIGASAPRPPPDPPQPPQVLAFPFPATGASPQESVRHQPLQPDPTPGLGLSAQLIGPSGLGSNPIGLPVMGWPDGTPGPANLSRDVVPPSAMPLPPASNLPPSSLPYQPDENYGGTRACRTQPPTQGGQPDQGLDPMSIVLTGMAQLQSVVSELASPKASERLEVIKPGVLALPELPSHGPESCLAFADWLHVTKPALADVSDTSERLWELTLAEANTWYCSYLKMGPLERLTTKPTPSSELSQPKWTRVSRRIESMINTACPSVAREEVSASRTSGLLALVCKLYVIYGPGSLTERELGLKHISDPPACTGVGDAIEALRRWKRWCSRMSELGGILPDSAIQVRALTKITRSVLLQHPEASFRINLAEAELQVDVVPDSDKVAKLHAQMLSELESMAYRGDKDRERQPKDQAPAPQPPPEVKGVEAATIPDPLPGGRPPKPPKGGPKGSPPEKGSDQPGAGTSKVPCTFYAGVNGCKKGSECTFQHNWSSFSPAEKAARCKTCGSKSHKAVDCKAGSRPEDKAKARPQRQPNVPKGPQEAVPVQQAQSPGQDNNQQIKSMLADAARFLQQAVPPPPPAAPGTAQPPTANPISGSPVTPQAKAPAPATVQGTPVTLASLSAQLDNLRAMVGNPEIRTCRVEPSDDEDIPLSDLVKGRAALREMVERYEAKVCKGCPDLPAISAALLDSGATHAVVPFGPNLGNLDRVPVTLAGDAKEEWWRTQGGTLVVPPNQDGSPQAARGQTILPLGALVEHLGCQVTWSRRKGLKVIHPTLGVLRTGVSGNTCPYVQETQALQLIAELEQRRLDQLQQQVDTLQCCLQEATAPLDPTDALRRYAKSGERRDALSAIFAQPYLQGLPEGVLADLAESIPLNDPEIGKALLKGLPLKRSSRRALLATKKWVVHLCSGPLRSGDPIASWCSEQGMGFIPVDLQQKGGKGKKERLYLQGRWSLASTIKGGGVPYLEELLHTESKPSDAFQCWSGTRTKSLFQGALSRDYERPTKVVTNLDISFLASLPRFGSPATPPKGREWTPEFRREIVRALQGKSSGPSVEQMAQSDAEALRRAFEEESEIGDEQMLVAEALLLQAFVCGEASEAVNEHPFSTSIFPEGRHPLPTSIFRGTGPTGQSAQSQEQRRAAEAEVARKQIQAFLILIPPLCELLSPRRWRKKMMWSREDAEILRVATPADTRLQELPSSHSTSRSPAFSSQEF